MKEETLVPYSVRLKPEQIAIIKQLHINFSNWVRERFDEAFTNPEEIDRSIYELQRQIENMNQRKALSIKKIEEDKKISEKELKFLLEARELLSRSPEYTDGKISFYTNAFGKTNRISKEDFSKLLERAAQIEEELKGD